MNNQADSSQEQLGGMQDINEQQLASVTGGGIISMIKNIFTRTKTVKPNPYADNGVHNVWAVKAPGGVDGLPAPQHQIFTINEDRPTIQ